MADRNFWTDERIEELKKLHCDGLSASQIAAEIGAESRSAICGKLHRLGIKRDKVARPRPARKPQPRKQTKAPQFNKMILRQRERIGTDGKIMTVFDKDLPPETERLVLNQRRRSLFELTTYSCRMPSGTPGTPGFYFCGSPEADNPTHPYCRVCAAGLGLQRQRLSKSILEFRASEDEKQRAKAVAIMAGSQRKESDDGKTEERESGEASEGQAADSGRPQRRRAGHANLSP